MAVLEEKVDRIEAALQRVERQTADILTELRHMPKASDFAALKADVARIDGRLQGVEARLSQVPNIWQIIAILATFTIGQAGIIFAAGNFFRP